MPVTPCTEPAFRQAAALITHWERLDIEAFVVLLSDLGLDLQAQDLVQALVMLRDRPGEEIAGLLPPQGTEPLPGGE
jgi:hypothetical protein